MDLDLEKAMAMLDGQNVEKFSAKLVTQQDKDAINEALELIFSGMSLQEWLENVVLMDAWHTALDKMQISILSLYDQPGTITEYLRYAVFEYKKRILKRLDCSIHSGEYINCPSDKKSEWGKQATNKISSGLNILKNIVEGFKPDFKIQNDTISRQYELQNDREYIRKK
ncbi:MAG: hypothetical protein MJ156_01575 [Alphaproteobacteria bacterium]|nr:hypothetical protein [Alphaproteobacteria bacterium]